MSLSITIRQNPKPGPRGSSPPSLVSRIIFCDTFQTKTWFLLATEIFSPAGMSVTRRFVSFRRYTGKMKLWMNISLSEWAHKEWHKGNSEWSLSFTPFTSFSALHWKLKKIPKHVRDLWEHWKPLLEPNRAELLIYLSIRWTVLPESPTVKITLTTDCFNCY